MAQGNNNTKTAKKTKEVSDCFSITVFSGRNLFTITFIWRFHFPTQSLWFSLSFDLCPVQKHGQVEETFSFLEGKALVLIIHYFIEKVTLGKGLILSGGTIWEANIHMGEVGFSLFSHFFQWPKRRKIHILNWMHFQSLVKKFCLSNILLKNRSREWKM